MPSRTKFWSSTHHSHTRAKYTTTLLTLRKNNSTTGQKRWLSLSTTLMCLISTFWCPLEILSDTNTCLTSWLEPRKISWYSDRLVLESQSLLETIWVVWSLISMPTLSWTSQPRPILKTFLMSFWIKINLPKKEELRSVLLVAKKWSSLSMILTCQLFKNTSLNLPTNCYDKSSIKVDSTIWKNFCSWRYPTVSS